VRPDPLGELHRSRTGFYRLLRPGVRAIGAAARGYERVSGTAEQRWDADPRYRPPGLAAYREPRG
jgi:hypothetical protein